MAILSACLAGLGLFERLSHKNKGFEHDSRHGGRGPWGVSTFYVYVLLHRRGFLSPDAFCIPRSITLQIYKASIATCKVAK